MNVQERRDLAAAPSRPQRVAVHAELRRKTDLAEARLCRLADDLRHAGLSDACALMEAGLLNVQEAGRALEPERHVGSGEAVQRTVDAVRGVRGRGL